MQPLYLLCKQCKTFVKTAHKHTIYNIMSSDAYLLSDNRINPEILLHIPHIWNAHSVHIDERVLNLDHNPDFILEINSFNEDLKLFIQKHTGHNCRFDTNFKSGSHPLWISENSKNNIKSFEYTPMYFYRYFKIESIKELIEFVQNNKNEVSEDMSKILNLTDEKRDVLLSMIFNDFEKEIKYIKSSKDVF